MQMTVDYFSEFFISLPRLYEILELHAKRSGISTQSALFLTVCSEFPDLILPISSDIITELENKGLIICTNGKPSVTSKGSILAKSFTTLRKGKI